LPEVGFNGSQTANYRRDLYFKTLDYALSEDRHGDLRHTLSTVVSAEPEAHVGISMELSEVSEGSGVVVDNGGHVVFENHGFIDVTQMSVLLNDSCQLSKERCLLKYLGQVSLGQKFLHVCEYRSEFVRFGQKCGNLVRDLTNRMLRLEQGHEKHLVLIVLNQWFELVIASSGICYELLEGGPGSYPLLGDL
jgi:hypothetical protein